MFNEQRKEEDRRERETHTHTTYHHTQVFIQAEKYPL